MTTTWHLSPPLARCATPGLTASVDLRQPRAGLSLPDGLQVLGVSCLGQETLDLFDCYQRGPDLVATYPDRKAFPVRVQVYWRIVPAEQLPPQAAGVDLQISVQTPLLDACPRVTAVSELPASEAFRLVDEATARFEPLNKSSAGGCLAQGASLGCTLVRGAGSAGRSYVEMVHPTDERVDAAQWVESQPASRLQLSHALFEESLEKGVILRARLRGVVVPRVGDEAAAVAAYRAFVASELPLTT